MSSIPTTEQARRNGLPAWVNRLSSSVRVWLGLVVFLFLVKLLLAAFYPNALVDPGQAAIFGWAPLTIISGLGLVGVLLSERTGFPEALDPRISNRVRILFPVLVGLAFSLLMVALDALTHFTETLNASHGVTQQYTGFIPMLLAFTAGAIIVEVIYRLLPIPLLLWLTSNLVLRGRWQGPIFWTLAILLSAFEPLSQDLGRLAGSVLWLHLGLVYAINLSQAAFFRKAGYLASILVRVAFYLVWHAIYAH